MVAYRGVQNETGPKSDRIGVLLIHYFRFLVLSGLNPEKSGLDQMYIKVILKGNNIYDFYVYTYLKGFKFFISNKK